MLKNVIWPLAKPRRQHLHHVINEMELPVTHVTERTGSPQKLVLTKTAELFKIHELRIAEAKAALNTLEVIKEKLF